MTMDSIGWVELLEAGFNALIDYVAYHVITCLIPAFLLAGAISVFLSREAIVKYLGSESRRVISFPSAAISGMWLAVCSCTVIPIAAGLYRRGSSVGPAFIFLWVAPAANILALTYTGVILGLDIAGARLFVAFLTAFVVGFGMTIIFKNEEVSRLGKGNSDERVKVAMFVGGKRSLILIILLLATLLVSNYVGAVLLNYLGVDPQVSKLQIYGYKLLIFAVFFAITMFYAIRFIEKELLKEWFRETLWFMRIVFPLLLVGVFVVGVVGKLLPEAWIREWLGGNGLQQTFIACIIGAVSYFATLTEAPFVSMLMKLGMGKGPALALLLTGPGMSLPNMLAIVRIFKLKKAMTYVLMTIVIAALASFAIANILWVS